MKVAHRQKSGRTRPDTSARSQACQEPRKALRYRFGVSVASAGGGVHRDFVGKPPHAAQRRQDTLGPGQYAVVA